MLAIFDEVALAAILVYYPSYERIHSEVHVRITDLPLGSSLRDLRRTNLNNLVRVSGVVTRRTGVFPQLKYVKFDCRKCGAFWVLSTKILPRKLRSVTVRIARGEAERYGAEADESEQNDAERVPGRQEHSDNSFGEDGR